MNQPVYVVTAYRWGDREEHSYVVGVYATEEAARGACIEERRFRGGKYECEARAVLVTEAWAEDDQNFPEGDTSYPLMPDAENPGACCPFPGTQKCCRVYCEAHP